MDDLKTEIRLLTRNIFPKKKVTKITKLRKEASLRSYYRIQLNGSKTIIAMVCPKDDEEASFLIKKVKDATQLFNEIKINVPQIYKIYDNNKMIFIHDIGSLSLELYYKKNGKKKCLNLYKSIIDVLFKLQTFSRSKKNSDLIPLKTSFSETKFTQELDFFLSQSPVSTFLNHKQLTELKQIFKDICQKLNSQKKTLTHRDLHSRNIFIKNDELSFIDHQDSRFGPYTYDLVSLLKDSYVNLDHKTESILISYYLDQITRENSSLNLTYESFFKDYYICTFQRSVKACGTFYHQAFVKNNLKYKKYIKTVIQYALIAIEKIQFDQNSYHLLSNTFNQLKGSIH